MDAERILQGLLDEILEPHSVGGADWGGRGAWLVSDAKQRRALLGAEDDREYRDWEIFVLEDDDGYFEIVARREDADAGVWEIVEIDDFTAVGLENLVLEG